MKNKLVKKNLTKEKEIEIVNKVEKYLEGLYWNLTMYIQGVLLIK